MYFKPDITREEIEKMPRAGFEGSIILIETVDFLNQIIPEIKKNNILGFDTETRPSFRKKKFNKVALLQLASENHVYLIRLNKTGLPDILKELLEDKNIIKAGVAIHDDIKKLKEKALFKPAGFIELQQFVRNFGINQISVKKLAAIVLGIRISKSQQTSNWDNERLSAAQLRYAATDAWVCYKIYTTLKESCKVDPFQR
ncbi:MAG: 3'-5' exonuclease domain-containing protein 2 [Bacteroidia bacterium]|nr:3'-5' exonuclease domain-containing protein 2 [Bacteroidia bacterium]